MTSEKEIVGEERIRLFQTIDDLHDTSEDFNILYKVYKGFYKDKGDETNDDYLNGGEIGLELNNEKLTEHSEQKELEETFDIENIPIVYNHGITMPVNDEQSVIIEMDVMNDLNENQAVIKYRDQMFEDTKEKENNSAVLNVSINVNEADIEVPWANKDVNPDNAVVVQHNLRQTDMTNNGEKAKLHDYLKWPHTPQRKGKKDTERLPYVLTSEEWQNLQKNKKLQKALEEERKAERKRIRLEKSEQKKQSQTKKKTKKQDISPKQSDSLKKVRAEEDFKTPDSKINMISNVIVQSKPSDKGMSHIKQLRFDDPQTSIKSSTNVVLHKDDFINNDRAVSGLCFICTYSLTPEKDGIKCITCRWVFHPMCIRKHKMPPFVKSWICNACCKKNI